MRFKQSACTVKIGVKERPWSALLSTGRCHTVMNVSAVARVNSSSTASPSLMCARLDAFCSVCARLVHTKLLPDVELIGVSPFGGVELISVSWLVFRTPMCVVRFCLQQLNSWFFTTHISVRSLVLTQNQKRVQPLFKSHQLLLQWWDYYGQPTSYFLWRVCPPYRPKCPKMGVRTRVRTHFFRCVAGSYA